MLGFTSVQPNLHLLHLDAITVIGVKVLLGLVASTQPTILQVNLGDLFGVAMKWRLVLENYMLGEINKDGSQVNAIAI